MTEMSDKCPTCIGSGEVHSHNSKCWDCNGIGYTVNGVIWCPPCGSLTYVDKAFACWKKTGKLLPDEDTAAQPSPVVGHISTEDVRNCIEGICKCDERAAQPSPEPVRDVNYAQLCATANAKVLSGADQDAIEWAVQRLRKYETGFEFDDGPYEGSYDDWVGRAFKAEQRVEKLEQLLHQGLRTNCMTEVWWISKARETLGRKEEK